MSLTKQRRLILVEEGEGFIQNLLVPAVRFFDAIKEETKL